MVQNQIKNIFNYFLTNYYEKSPFKVIERGFQWNLAGTQFTAFL
jgi:hypothetical protein